MNSEKLLNAKKMVKPLKERHAQNINFSHTHPKVSSQTVNNLAKKILSQNNSIVSASSIAASSSSAVASASSLTSSLTKLNFK